MDSIKSELPVIPIAKPSLGDAELKAVAEVMETGWVTQGPAVEAFEREFAAYTGAPHACAVSSCTTALHLALLAAGVRPGDEVVTASHSFIATANAIRYCGALPVFADIEPSTYNLDPQKVRDAVTPRTRAILTVHQLGMPCDLKALAAIGREFSIPVIEDAACAAGSEVRLDKAWEKIGKPHADIACFSFHPRKVITTGDGGMITTSNPEWDKLFRLWRQHGMSISDTRRHSSTEILFESYPVMGYNYRMTDIQAAVGRVQLKRLSEIVAARRALAERYRAAFASVSEIILPQEPAWAKSNWQSFCVLLADDLDQREVMQFMRNRGISTRRGVMCTHREAAYGAGTWRCAKGHTSGQACAELLQSEKGQDKGLILPLFSQMTQVEQERVIASLLEACALARR